MSFREHYRARSRVLAFAAALALGSALGRPRPPPRTLDGLSALLGAAADGTVQAKDVAWEPSRGLLVDAVLGRRILFLSPSGPERARDVFRARVRVSFEGHPIEVASLRNLTRTPLGDESALDLAGHTVAFAALANGRVQGVTALDLDGPPRAERPHSFAARLVSLVAAAVRTGTLRGLGETNVVWDVPPSSAKVALEPPRLRVDTEDPPSTVEIDLRSGEVARSASGENPEAVSVVRHDESERSALPWAIDLARPVLRGTIAGHVLRAFSWGADLLRRAAIPFRRMSAENRPRTAAAQPSASVPPTSPDAMGFPPPDLTPVWEASAPGEGHWAAARAPFLPPVPGSPNGAHPYFYTTFVRPDPARPRDEIVLVAMNLALLELGLESGYDEPRSLAGPGGTGHVPRDAPESSRLVGAFNGGAVAQQGRYGIRIRHRDLSPPVPHAATWVVTDDGDVGLGPFPDSREGPPELLSFRQGPGLPRGDGDSLRSERTALCRLPSGHLVYAWGKHVTVGTLARAIQSLHCANALLLASGRGRTGFAFLRAQSDPRLGTAELVRPEMTINPRKFFTGSESDFFYVLLRRPSPDKPAGAEWKVSEGVQPEPAWVPGIFETRRSLGELDVRIMSFEAGRVAWVLRAGSEEPGAPGSRAKKIALSPELEQRVVATVGLGHTTEALRYGLAFQGEPSLPLRQSYATLVLSESRPPRIAAPGERPDLLQDEDAVQLPLLADHGEIDRRGVDGGSLRLRGAACVTSSGRLLVATARHDSNEPLGSALLEAGCARVVSLDRGSRHPAFLHRTGTAESPDVQYGGSVLYAVSRPMAPHTVQFPKLP